MKVLHIQKVTGISGSERHILGLLPALTSAGVEARMCVLGVGGYEPFVETLRERGVRVDALPAGPDIDPLIVKKIFDRIREFGPDIVHTHLIHADTHGQIAARLAGVPTVSSVHSTNAFYVREPYRSVARVAGHLARRTIAISEHVSRFVESLKLARRGSIRIVHYGIDVPEWVLPEDARSSTRDELGLGVADIAIGVASRLVPFKGHDFLLDAFTQARSQDERLQLLVAGDGPLRSRFEARVRRDAPPGAVRLLGHVGDIRSFMAACDVMVFPTVPGFGEGFGLAALEAMASGRPVIASAVDSLPEIVRDGETGYLVPPWDVDRLAETLVTLAQKEPLRRSLGAQARDRARNTFALGATVERTLEVYREAI